MKCLTTMLIFISFQSFALLSYSQITKISLNANNSTVKQVLNEIEEKSDFYFTYDSKLVDTNRRVVIEAVNKNVEEILSELFINQSIQYEIKDKHIVLYHTSKNEVKQVKQVNKKEVSGVILDKENEPVIGATISIKGTSQGTVTDIDGNFSLTVVTGDVLEISYVGYLTQEIKIANQTKLEILLKEDVAILDELVVVGYGVQKKGNLTAAISTLKSEDMKSGTSSSLAQKIQGRIPGLQIRQQAGEPGDFRSTINIRGLGEPLYVIDGIVRDGGVEFQQLNPNDIESISILKDASAAVYGLDAANGVILVTTKKGKKGRPQFSYSGAVGWQTPTDRPKMSSASQYLEMYNDAIFYRDGKYSISKEELNKWKEGGPGYESTDWYKETMKNSAMQQQHDFSVRGGNDIVKYFVSFGYYNEEGLFKSNDMNYNRYNFRSNITANLSEHLTADVMLSGRYSQRDFPGGDGFIWTYKGTVISLPNEQPFIDGNPDYPANIRNQQNPVLMSQKRYAGYTEDRNKSFQSSASLNYDVPFILGLQAKGTIAYDSFSLFNKNVWKNYRIYSPNLESINYNSPRIANGIDDVNRIVLQGQLNYNKTFLENHNVAGTVVFERKYYSKKHASLKREYDFYTNDVVDFASGLQTNSGSELEEATMSYVGRFNYDYKGKYLMEYAFRYDGSYRYAAGKRWAYFPSASVGWRISEESFFKDNVSFVDNLKLRASYGSIGENVGQPFQHILGYESRNNEGSEFINGQQLGGIIAPGVINPNFTWVKSKIGDIGAEISILNNLFALEIDYYQRDKTGKLKRREVGTGLPNTFGGSMPEENLESDRTRGFDFVLSHQNKIDKVKYGVSFNMNLARTMHRIVDKPDARSSYDRWANGYENRWNDAEWGWDRVGQFQNFDEINNAPIHGQNLDGNKHILPGDFVYNDANGDGIIDEKDRQPLFRNRTPKLFYGFTLNAEWNNFDIYTVFQGAALYTVRFNEVYSHMFFNNGNLPAYFYDRWHQEDVFNPNSEWVSGQWPATRFEGNIGSSYRESDAWRINASFLRLKSLEIGYTMPQKLTRKYYMDNVRIYANGANLITFADAFLKQFDPEKYEGDYNGGYNYPLTKGFNIGINVTF